MPGREVSAERVAAMRADLDAVRDRIAEGQFDGSTDDGHIMVTVDSEGRLLDVRFDPRAFRRVDSEGFRESVLLAYERATAEARRNTEEALQEVLGPAVTLDGLESAGGLPQLLRSVGQHLMSQYALGRDSG